MTIVTEEIPVAIELQFSSTEEGTEDKLGDDPVIWKDILREGAFAITPGRAQKVPFQVIAQGKSDAATRTISMSDLIESFDARAFEDVTIPDGHPKKGDSALNNNGYVRALRTIKKRGKHYLQGALGFTEPDVAGKVRRGSVPNVSSGVFFNFTRKADGKTFPAALNHVALTKTAWVDDLDPFKRVFASDANLADEDFEIESFEFDGDPAGGSGSDNQGDAVVVWNQEDSTQFVREQIRLSLNPPVDVEAPQPIGGRAYYDVIDISRSDTALVEEFYQGATRKFVIPFKLADGKVQVAPQLRWQEVEDALIAASDEDTPLDKVLAAIRVNMADESAKQADAKRPAPAKTTITQIVLADENTPEGQVQAARKRRELLYPELFANH